MNSVLYSRIQRADHVPNGLKNLVVDAVEDALARPATSGEQSWKPFNGQPAYRELRDLVLSHFFVVNRPASVPAPIYELIKNWNNNDLSIESRNEIIELLFDVNRKF